MYDIVRSRRKTLSICITKDARVEVRAPLSIPDEVIRDFVQSRQEWIQNHLHQQMIKLKEREQFHLSVGDAVPVLGIPRKICTRDGKAAGFDGNQFYVPPGLQPEQIRNILIQLYRSMAKDILPRKTEKFSNLMGVNPSGLRITGAETRWGSCSGKKRICYSWKLIMAQEEAVDYVVVHELAHLTEMNHSKRFWNIVESVMPDWRQRRRMLRELSEILARQSWNEEGMT